MPCLGRGQNKSAVEMAVLLMIGRHCYECVCSRPVSMSQEHVETFEVQRTVDGDPKPWKLNPKA